MTFIGQNISAIYNVTKNTVKSNNINDMMIQTNKMDASLSRNTTILNVGVWQ